MNHPRVALCLLLSIVVAGAAAGCLEKKMPDDGKKPGGVSNFVIPNGNPGPQFDLSIPTGSQTDASMPYPSGGQCSGLIACYGACNSSGDPSCFSGCESQAGSAAVSAFNNALSCAQLWCINQKNTVSSYKCVISSDQTQLVNLDGSAATAGTVCGDCLGNATSTLFQSSCSSSSSPDCNPGACSSERAACLNN